MALLRLCLDPVCCHKDLLWQTSYVLLHTSFFKAIIRSQSCFPRFLTAAALLSHFLKGPFINERALQKKPASVFRSPSFPRESECFSLSLSLLGLVQTLRPSHTLTMFAASTIERCPSFYFLSAVCRAPMGRARLLCITLFCRSKRQFVSWHRAVIHLSTPFVHFPIHLSGLSDVLA